MAVDTSRLRRALQEYGKLFEPYTDVWRGKYVSDNGDGTHQVTMLQPDGTDGPTRTVYGRVSAWPGVVLRIGEDRKRWGPQEYVILGPDETGYGSSSAPSLLEAHGPTHGDEGRDRIPNLHPFQIWPLRVQPHSGMTVRVQPGLFYADGGYHYLENATSVNLAGQIPAGVGQERYVTLSIDGTDTVNTTAGTASASADAEDIPNAPIGERPLAAVLIRNGDTVLTDDRIRGDLRFMPGFNSGGAGGDLWENVRTVAIAGGEYTSVQSAIDAAAANDIIMIMAGTYTEDVTVNKNVALWGFNRDQTIISGEVDCTSPCYLANIRISHSDNSGGQINALDVNVSGDNNVDCFNCEISVSQAGAGDAVAVYNQSTQGGVLLAQCRLFASSTGGTAYGAWAQGAICSVDVYWSNVITGVGDFDLYGNAGNVYVAYSLYAPAKTGVGGGGGIVEDDAAELLASLITVDGAGSGLDADLLDSYNSSQAGAASSVVVTTAAADVQLASGDLYTENDSDTTHGMPVGRRLNLGFDLANTTLEHWDVSSLPAGWTWANYAGFDNPPGSVTYNNSRIIVGNFSGNNVDSFLYRTDPADFGARTHIGNVGFYCDQAGMICGLRLDDGTDTNWVVVYWRLDAVPQNPQVRIQDSGGTTNTGNSFSNPFNVGLAMHIGGTEWSNWSARPVITGTPYNGTHPILYQTAAIGGLAWTPSRWGIHFTSSNSNAAWHRITVDLCSWT